MFTSTLFGCFVSHHTVWIVILAMATVMSGCVAPLVAAQEEQQNAQAEAKLVDLIEQLDASQFVDRESATRKLIDAGEDSVPHLLRSMSKLSAEGRFRSLFVLEHLSIDRRREAQRVARAAIEELVGGEDSNLAQAAELSLLRINRWRSENTLKDLAAEGATINYRWEYNNGQQEQMPELIRIDENWQGEVASLDRLAWIENVNQVELHGSRITNEVVEFALQAKGLTVLRLKDATISDELWIGLDERDKLTPLFALEIKYCPIGDRSLESISHMRTLQVVSLFGTKVTQAGAQQLGQQIPGAEVDYRQGGFLGVRGINDRAADGVSTRCLISSIEPESAAARSRLQMGDIILEANGQGITTIEGLINVARPLEPGDAITLKIDRKGETFEEKILLGRWE